MQHAHLPTEYLLIAGVVIVLVGFAYLRRRGRPPAATSPEIVEEFRRRRRRQWLIGIPIFVLVSPLIFRHKGEPLPGGLPYAALCCGVIIVTLIASHRNWRCPACGAYLGRYSGDRCRKCGVGFR